MESLKWVAEKACEGWVLVLPLVCAQLSNG